MIVKEIKEVFGDYKKPSLLVAVNTCSGKCWKELGLNDCCQNSHLSQLPDIHISEKEITDIYMKNGLVKAIIIAGLEPFEQTESVIEFIRYFRKYTNDDIVIFTGYNKDEISAEVYLLKMFPNIIIKYGRFVPNYKSKYDEVLGIVLISENQYAEKIS